MLVEKSLNISSSVKMHERLLVAAVSDPDPSRVSHKLQRLGGGSRLEGW